MNQTATLTDSLLEPTIDQSIGAPLLTDQSNTLAQMHGPARSLAVALHEIIALWDAPDLHLRKGASDREIHEAMAKAATEALCALGIYEPDIIEEIHDDQIADDEANADLRYQEDELDSGVSH